MFVPTAAPAHCPSPPVPGRFGGAPGALPALTCRGPRPRGAPSSTHAALPLGEHLLPDAPHLPHRLPACRRLHEVPKAEELPSQPLTPPLFGAHLHDELHQSPNHGAEGTRVVGTTGKRTEGIVATRLLQRREGVMAHEDVEELTLGQEICPRSAATWMKFARVRGGGQVWSDPLGKGHSTIPQV